jgi:hypothetical protein
MLRRRNKIRERVHLRAHAPGVVPRLAQFAASANVRNRENDSAIQQAQAIRVERHRHRNSITPISVQQQWRAAIAF